MNLTQIIVYKHQDQQSFVFFNTKAQSAHTCVAVLTPDSLIVKYFMTLCMFELFSECSEATQTCLSEELSFQHRSPELKSTYIACASCYQFSMLTQLFNTVLYRG